MKRCVAFCNKAKNIAIINSEAGSRNVTEWAKKQLCWDRVQSLQIEIPKAFVDELLDPTEYNVAVKEALSLPANGGMITSGNTNTRCCVALWRCQTVLSSLTTHRCIHVGRQQRKGASAKLLLGSASRHKICCAQNSW
jgi:hypothetical protein